MLFIHFGLLFQYKISSAPYQSFFFDVKKTLGQSFKIVSLNLQDLSFLYVQLPVGCEQQKVSLYFCTRWKTKNVLYKEVLGN